MSGIICTSEAATLALHAAGVMAAHEGSVSTHTMAEALGASEATLSKVMQRMVKAGLATSRRGPHGGFELARSRETITLLDVYESVEGAINVKHCLLGAPVCGKKHCPLGSLFEKVTREVTEKLAKTTLQEFNVPIHIEG